MTTEIKTEATETEKQIKSDNIFDFSNILDQVGNLGNNNNIVINDNPDVTINIYMNGIDMDVMEDNSNLSFIDLEECGDNLKQFYNLDPNENLYIASYESANSVENRVTNQVKYEIYLKNGTQLKDLSVCNNVSISVSSSISNLDMINFEQAKLLSMQGYDIYNLSSEFYTDKCAAANINGNDIVLKDRKENIYPSNVSFCEKGCELDMVKLESKRIKCNCNISKNEENVEIADNQTALIASEENFLIYLLDSLNYKIFECYKNLIKLRFKDLIRNTGFFFGIGFLIFNIICCIIFTHHYLPQIKIQVYKLLPQNKDSLKEIKQEIISKRYKKKRKTRKKSASVLLRNNNIRITKKGSKTILLKNVRRKTTKISRNSLLRNIDRRKTTKSSRSILLRNSDKRKTNKRKSSLTISKFKKNKLIINKKNKNIINKNIETAGNLIKLEEQDYNVLPYSEALKLDNRNIFMIYMSLLKKKIDIISILFYPEDFTHKSLTLCIYALDFLLSFFTNALLYTDDVISEKYHNNGQLDLLTTLFLSLTSNIISFIIMFIIKKIVTYNEYLSRMVRDVYKTNEYILTFSKLYLVLKIKVFIFFFISFILSLFFTIYLLIFCQIYANSQGSLIINYLMSLIESSAYSVGVPLIICILRFLGLKQKLIYIYRTSVYLDDLL